MGRLNVYRLFNFLFLSSIIAIVLIINFRYGIIYLDKYLMISISLCYLIYRMKIKNDTYFTFKQWTLIN